jgi:hypothetical protein
LEHLRRSVNLAEHGLTMELRAYQCHVFLDWRELRATAEQPWDRLCDELGGRGVGDLEDALIRLELRPAHDALRRLLEPALVRHLPELAERAPAGPEKRKALELQREDFLQNAWKRCREFLREAQSFYCSHGGLSFAAASANPASLEKRFHELLRAAMRIPALENLFPEPWPAAARRVLPSLSPQLTATAMWGPVLAWSVLELLAEFVHTQDPASATGGPPAPAAGAPPAQGGPHPPSFGECGVQPASATRLGPQRTALDLFDRLRLREPLANAFQSLGFEGEEGWRVAARIKVALLIEAGVIEDGVFAAAEPTLPEEAAPAPPSISQPPSERPIALLSPALWQDPDVRWLTGAHLDAGHSYFVKESYEELLWWLQLPALCRLAAESKPARSGIQQISRTVADAAESAALADYCVDALFP